MNKQELIDTLKAQYNKNLRKQLVASLLESEDNEETEKQYKLMNQIFSYVLSQLGWTMAENAQSWDSTPLDIMTDVFPKINKTKWFKEQHITANHSIDIVMDNPKS
jgi:DNA-binding ferritin-like protein